jgi:hypothetical protein
VRPREVDARPEVLDHLEGRPSIMPNDDEGEYRDVVVGAIAQWLASDSPKAKLDQVWLRQELESMRTRNSQYHLRIAAWDTLLEAHLLRD